jgi:hypothetical protein
MEGHGGKILTGENRRTRRKTCPSATGSIRNPTQTYSGANPGARSDRPAINRLSHGTAREGVPRYPFQWSKISHGSVERPVYSLCYLGEADCF